MVLCCYVRTVHFYFLLFIICTNKCTQKHTHTHTHIYRVIYKSRRDFRPLRYSSRDDHAEGEHVNRGRDTPSFCHTLQVLDTSTLGDAADVNPVIKFLPHTLHASPRVDISSTCKVGQKIGVPLPLLTCSPSA